MLNFKVFFFFSTFIWVTSKNFLFLLLKIIIESIVTYPNPMDNPVFIENHLKHEEVVKPYLLRRLRNIYRALARKKENLIVTYQQYARKWKSKIKLYEMHRERSTPKNRSNKGTRNRILCSIFFSFFFFFEKIGRTFLLIKF